MTTTKGLANPHAAKTWVKNLRDMFRSARWHTATAQSLPPQRAQSLLPETNAPVGAPRAIALLIDAENISPRAVERLMAVAKQHGVVSHRLAFGDWTSSSSLNTAGWIPVLSRHAISPMQTFRQSSRKNGADIALVIWVMDMLHRGPKVDDLLIASSDTDFSALAVRARAGSGLGVYGYGERHASAAYIAAFDHYYFVEKTIEPLDKAARLDQIQLTRFEDLLLSCFETYAGDVWVDLAVIGSLLRSRDPAFSVGPFARAKLGRLVESLKTVEIKRPPGSTQWYVRRKQSLKLVHSQPTNGPAKPEPEPDVFTRLRATLGVEA